MDSKLPALKTENWLGDINYDKELLNMTESPTEGLKYSSGSSVYTSQSIVNLNSDEVTYCIASIIQSEIFDHLEYAGMNQNRFYDLNILTALPPHLGGPVATLDPQLVDRETTGDPELRAQLLLGTVPTVDTILRFICWIYQSAKYSAQCNILAFIYIKRIITSQRILHMKNWRGLWLGAIIIAQKFADDKCLRTGSFASILPGVDKEQLKAVELRVFQLLGYTGQVKPAVFAKFYYELRCIFQAITGQPAGGSKGADGKIRPPLRKAEGLRLFQAPEDRPESSPRRVKTRTAAELIAPGKKSSDRNRALPPLAASKSQDLYRGDSHSATAGISTHSAADSSATIGKLPPVRLQPVGGNSRGQKAPGESKISLKYALRRPRAVTVEDQKDFVSKAIFVLN